MFYDYEVYNGDEYYKWVETKNEVTLVPMTDEEKYVVKRLYEAGIRSVHMISAEYINQYGDIKALVRLCEKPEKDVTIMLRNNQR